MRGKIGWALLPLRMPEIGGLAVNGILRGAILLVALLAVNISNGPAVVAQPLPGFIEQIQFRDRRVRFAVLRGDGLKAKVAVRWRVESRNRISCVSGPALELRPMRVMKLASPSQDEV